jgi:hypothetical protein
MPDDFDHEVIDSAEALLRHLYEAHGVEEALDLDPATAPVQFWLRRHAELERDARSPGAAPQPAPQPRLPGEARSPGEARQPTSPPRPAPRTSPPPPSSPAPRTPPPPPPGSAAPAASGPRYRPFADPLVEAVAAALVRHGLEERRVRRWIASYSSPDGRGGEDAVRSSFLAPVLDALAAQVSGAGGRTPPAPPRDPAPPPVPPAAATPNLDADFMAIADILQSRRRRGGRSRREPPAPPAPPPPGPVDDHDDYMALADAVQQRRRRGGTRR